MKYHPEISNAMGSWINLNWEASKAPATASAVCKRILQTNPALSAHDVATYVSENLHTMSNGKVKCRELSELGLAALQEAIKPIGRSYFLEHGTEEWDR